MFFSARNFRQMGRYFFLFFIFFVLMGCAGSNAPSGIAGENTEQEELVDLRETAESKEPEGVGLSEEPTAGIISEEEPVETENAVYYIREQQTEKGALYPQLELKGEKDIVCGADFLNDLLKNQCDSDSYAGYQVFYADEEILSVCFRYDTGDDRIFVPMVIDLQCVNYRNTVIRESYLEPVQDDNIWPGAPASGNGVRISFDALFQELEKGSCELDQEAYALWQSEPEFVIRSIQEHFEKMQNRGLQETYFGYMKSYNTGARGMYLKEGRVGFFISLPECWEEVEADAISYEAMPFDFRVEIAYDWKAELSRNQVSYQVYRKEAEDGAYGCLQVSGLGDKEEAVNQAIWEDLQENLSYLDLDKTNQIMADYRDDEYWQELPQIGPPRVTWQTERYLCIRQEPLLEDSEVLRYAEEWKRYHVYDLETGRSLKLGDILNLNSEFAAWLKEEKKVEGWAEYHEGDTPGELGDRLRELLDQYSEQQLLSALEAAEFWMKEGALYFRLPFLNQWDKPLYSYGGTGWPDYPVYAECRIKTADLAMWINEDHGEIAAESIAGESFPKKAVELVQDMPVAVYMLAGADYHIALCEDGTVWSWGENGDGKLGVAADALSRPERIPGLENVIKLVNGGKDIFALTAEGEVYYWGWGLENIWYEKKDADSMVYTPTRIEGLEEIADMDAKNGSLFVLDKEGRLRSLGLYFDYEARNDLIEVFSSHEELGQDIDRIVAGAGDYHYFVRKDGTVFSIMEYDYDGSLQYRFIFPAQEKNDYGRPEDLENVTILNEQTKEGYIVYYDLAGIGGVEAASSDGYTVFFGKTDGTLWYWDSDRIKYHDNELALVNPESAEESCAGRLVQMDIREILNIDEDAAVPRIIAMQSGRENTMFLADNGSVFISRYETCGVEDVFYYDKNNPRPGDLPSIRQIRDLELKTLVFERLGMENIVSISTDGEENFTAVDADGVYYRFSAAEGEAVRAYREFLAGERRVGTWDIYELITPTGEPDRRYAAWYCIWDVDGDGTPELHVLSGREYILYSYREGEMVYFNGFFSRPWRNVPLESGAFIDTYDLGTTIGDGYYYFELDGGRETVLERRFYWIDTNENLVCDEEDRFWYEGEYCSMEEWFVGTKQYILLTKDGRTRVRNSVAWTVLCEEI